MENLDLVDRSQPSGPTGGTLSLPASWKESLLALGPFLYIPLVSMISWILYRAYGQSNFPDFLLPVFAITTVLVPILLFVAAIGVSVKRRFPRWTMPYWGLLAVLLAYLMQFSGTIAGQQFDGGWWVWLPLLLAASVGLLLRQGGRQSPAERTPPTFDWTCISFAIYGVAPAYLFAAFDEVHDSQPMVTSSLLLLAAGALLHMRGASKVQRILSLALGIVLGWGLAAVNLANYWGGRQEPWMSQPGDWWGTLLPVLAAGGMLLVLMLVPWLVSEIKKLLTRRLELSTLP